MVSAAIKPPRFHFVRNSFPAPLAPGPLVIANWLKSLDSQVNYILSFSSMTPPTTTGVFTAA